MADHATYHLGDCTVTVAPSWCVTAWPDGLEVHAHPDGSADQAATAKALGYGDDVGRMTAEHDLIHTLLAVAAGHPHSPTLRGVAAGEPADPDVAACEERQVMLVQRLLNVGLAGVLGESLVEDVA